MKGGDILHEYKVKKRGGGIDKRGKGGESTRRMRNRRRKDIPNYQLIHQLIMLLL